MRVLKPFSLRFLVYFAAAGPVCCAATHCTPPRPGDGRKLRQAEINPIFATAVLLSADWTGLFCQTHKGTSRTDLPVCLAGSLHCLLSAACCLLPAVWAGCEARWPACLTISCWSVLSLCSEDRKPRGCPARRTSLPAASPGRSPDNSRLQFTHYGCPSQSRLPDNTSADFVL